MPCNIEILKQVPLFATMDNEELAILASEVELKKFAARQRIYKMGAPAERAYVVISGHVQVTTVDEDNQEVVIDEPPSVALRSRPAGSGRLCVKPIAKTDSCQASHYIYQISGTMTTRMDDGTDVTSKAGDVLSIPAGHDAWVVGNEPVVFVDFQGMVDYAKQK